MNKFRSTILGGASGVPATPSANDHRDEVRHCLARETATIGFNGATLEVDVINLSGGGAMIEADISPQLWDRVDLYLGEGSPIECAVRWLRGGRIGLEFAHETRIECAPEERDALLLEVIRRSFPDILTAAPPVAPDAKADTVDDSRRTASRHPLIWNGKIAWQHEARTVRLRNISASGVLIDSQIDFPEGAELILDLGKSGKYAVTVGWSRGGQAGLVFKAPFMLSALAAARPEVTPQRWQRPAYLDRCADPSSPWESGWDRSALTDLGADLEGFLKY